MGARPDDQLDFASADLGFSRKVALTVASAVSDKLTPGRWLVQLIGNTVDRAWVRVGPFVSGTPVVANTDVPSTPMGAGGILGFEINVRPGFNDQIAGIMAANTATLILTPISRVPRVS